MEFWQALGSEVRGLWAFLAQRSLLRASQCLSTGSLNIWLCLTPFFYLAWALGKKNILGPRNVCSFPVCPVCVATVTTAKPVSCVVEGLGNCPFFHPAAHLNPAVFSQAACAPAAPERALAHGPLTLSP